MGGSRWTTFSQVYPEEYSDAPNRAEVNEEKRLVVPQFPYPVRQEIRTRGRRFGPVGAYSFKVDADDGFVNVSESDKDGSTIRIMGRTTLEFLYGHRVSYWTRKVVSDDRYIYILHNNTCCVVEKSGFERVIEVKAGDPEVKGAIEATSAVDRLPISRVGRTRNVIARFSDEERRALEEGDLTYSFGVVLQDQRPLSHVLIPRHVLDPGPENGLPRGVNDRIDSHLRS